MASVRQKAGCQGSPSDAAGSGGGGGDLVGADAAAPAGKSQRLLGGQSLSPAAFALTAAQHGGQSLVHVEEMSWAGSPLLAQGCR